MALITFGLTELGEASIYGQEIFMVNSFVSMSSGVTISSSAGNWWPVPMLMSAILAGIAVFAMFVAVQERSAVAFAVTALAAAFAWATAGAGFESATASALRLNDAMEVPLSLLDVIATSLFALYVVVAVAVAVVAGSRMTES